jgi:type VI secretion system protein ImpH
MPDLMSRLREHPQGFDLFQAISLLERAEPGRERVGISLGIDEALRLSAQVELGFAPSDIDAIAQSQRPGPPLTLWSCVMTLAGAQGPLPMPFTELLMERSRLRDRAGLAFLDIFNQRLLGFLYRSRRKHHVALSGADLQDAPSLRVLDALSALGRAEGARAPQGQQGWLRHAGLQGAAPRSMGALLALLRDRLGIHWSGRQFMGSWHALEESGRSALGGPIRGALGAGTALGARGWDQEAGIELSTPALSQAQYQALLPGGRHYALLAWLVGRHQQREIRFVVQLALAAPQPTRLSRDAPLLPRLGLSAWLGTPTQVQGPRFVLSSEPVRHAN